MKKQPDLRSYLDDLRREKPEWLIEIEEEVPVDYTSTAVALELDKQGKEAVTLFNNIKGSETSLISNLFVSEEVMAFSVGKTKEEFKPYLAECMDNLIPSVESSSPPVQDIVLKGDDADVTKLPIPYHFDGDAGPYITAGMVSAQDPNTGAGNLAYARVQVKGSRRLGISLHSRQHLWDYHRRAKEMGKDLPAAIVIGAHPAVLIATAAKLGISEDEHDFAGALMGQPLEICKAKTVDVTVPAYAEIVIEGHILADADEKEGPFGEYTGYLTGTSTNNVFEVSAITMREKAIYTDVVPGNSAEHLILGRIVKEAWVHKRMKEALPFFVDFHFPTSGTHFHCYLRIEKQGEGYAKQAAELLMGLDHYVKMVIVVDTDIDPKNEAEVMWAVAMRMQADRDVAIMSNVICNRLDPSQTGGVGAKMIIDATKPVDETATRCALPEDAKQLAKKLLAGK